MKEHDFFAHIAARLGRQSALDSAPVRSVVGVPAFWREPSAHPTDQVAKFQEELENLGGQVRVVENAVELRDALVEFLALLQPTRVGVWGGTFTADYGLTAVLQPYETVDWESVGVAGFKSVDASISGCAYAIADTGTIVMMSTPAQGRSVAVLPAVHIVIIHRSQMRSRLGEVLADFAGPGTTLPSSIHFISGPSRSSDIENDQTIGIHGPAAVIALIVQSPA